jgi:hypothetical protein
MLVVIGSRLVLLGQPPFTDEGSYISLAYFLWHHPDGVREPPCALSGLNLYPTVFAWLCALPGSVFLHFRATDAVLAGLCAATFYAVLRTFTGRPAALTQAVLWTMCFNHPAFVNAGFKNPFAPGFTCVLGALWLARKYATRPWPWAAGALLGMAFLLREPLITCLVPVLVYAGAQRGPRGVAQIVVACVATIALGVAALAWSRGIDLSVFVTIIQRNWRELAALHRALTGAGELDASAIRRDELLVAWRTAGWLVPFWAAGALLALWASLRDSRARVPVLVGVLLMLAPLPEFLLKLGFRYHLSAMLIGLSLLAALGWQWLGQRRRRAQPLAVAVLLVAAGVVPAGAGQSSLDHWWRGWCDALLDTRRFWRVMVEDDWSTPAVADSFYLRTAASIRRHSTPDDRLLVSGFYLGLFPLSRRLPVAPSMADLSVYAFSRNMRLEDAERAALNRELPVLFVETNRFPSVDLKVYFAGFEQRFRLVDQIAPGAPHYGQFGGRLWQREDAR